MRIVQDNINTKDKVDSDQTNKRKKLYLESYGCQMNFSDSEVVTSILHEEGYDSTPDFRQADLILLNTCSIREKAELTVRKRLTDFNALKKSKPSLNIGVLGCMAERLKDKFLEEEKLVDMVVGPDAYRDLPNLLNELEDGRNAVNVILSKEETYADLSPVRLDKNGVSGFVSITRGCDNMCTFCVVPFTRGRERSRDPESILKECVDLFDKGYREVTLLGQNVDSYLWFGGGLNKDFAKASDIQKATAIHFSQLLDMVATKLPNMRIRFSTSNPQDMTREVLYVMAKHKNICDYIHLPVQSGSTSVLKRMNRQHTREEYIQLIDDIRRILPECTVSFDMITGFCGETEEEHQDTLSLIDYVRYDFGYMFTYSERPGTLAYKKLKDDVPEDVKKRRLQEIIKKQRAISHENLKNCVGKTFEVLIEGNSKKNDSEWYGRTSQNSVAVFPKTNNTKPGDFVNVYIEDCTSATLLGKAIN